MPVVLRMLRREAGLDVAVVDWDDDRVASLGVDEVVVAAAGCGGAASRWLRGRGSAAEA
jgi:hypothetical protein